MACCSLTFQLLAGLPSASPWRSSAPTACARRYGALLLSTLLLWAYMHAMQYIIIWAGNIPDEVEWYIRHSTRSLGVRAWGMVFLQFVIPFFAMLSARVRSRTDSAAGDRRRNAGVALRRVVPADASRRRCRRDHSVAGNTRRGSGNDRHLRIVAAVHARSDGALCARYAGARPPKQHKPHHPPCSGTGTAERHMGLGNAPAARNKSWSRA